MKLRLFSALFTAVGLLAAGGQAFAGTKTVCSNVNLVASGYLLIKKNIQMGSCPTGKGSTWSTPKENLVILHSEQLIGFEPPYAVVKRDAMLGAEPRYTIKAVVDGLGGCVTPVIRPYGFFTKGAGSSGACAPTGPGINNYLKYYQHMWVELAKPAGKPGELRVKLNTSYVGASRNYAITTTSKLHGGTTTYVKSALQTSKTYTLKDLGPEFVSQAKQGATFTFKVEMFLGSQSNSKYTLSATGQEMIKN